MFWSILEYIIIFVVLFLFTDIPFLTILGLITLMIILMFLTGFVIGIIIGLLDL